MAIASELAQFPNEAAFRDQFLVPLFLRLGFTVHNYHGTREYGKDLLLGKMDEFGDRVYYGVQAKFEDSFKKIRALSRCKSKSKLKKGMQREPMLMVFGHTLGTPSNTVSDHLSDYPWYSVVALDSGIGLVLDDDNGRPSKAIWLSTFSALEPAAHS